MKQLSYILYVAVISIIYVENFFDGDSGKGEGVFASVSAFRSDVPSSKATNLFSSTPYRRTFISSAAEFGGIENGSDGTTSVVLDNNQRRRRRVVEEEEIEGARRRRQQRGPSVGGVRITVNGCPLADVAREDAVRLFSTELPERVQ